MKTIQDILKLSTDHLKKHAFDHPRREAEDLISDALALPRVELYVQFDRPLLEAELDRCRNYLQRRTKGEPLPYIHGEVDFAGCRLKITKDVLIPRQETEILVDLIKVDQGILWDICTGSGCIAISLKNMHPELEVFASDISSAALKIAQENAIRNKTDITFLEGDLLLPFKEKKAHYIVCNPPYVSEKEFLGLDHEVKDFEPRLALIGGPSGLEYYQRLAHDLPNYLFPGGKVWFEIGQQQGEALLALFDAPCWRKRQVMPDWSGKNRFFFLERE